MSDSEQLSAGFDQDISDIKPAEAFVIPSQASKTIWDVNANNILQISSQIISLIKNNKISIQMVLHLIDVFSILRVKNIQYYAELYQKISNEFSCSKPPENDELSNMLKYKGFNAGDFRPCCYIDEEEILNIYGTESPLYYIVWDKVDELEDKFPVLDVDDIIDYEITPLDCAIKYGSELCFNYLKNMGAMYTEKSSKYAVMGGNFNIFSQMIEDGQSFDKLINKALRYKNYKIAQYLKSNFGQRPNSIAKSMYFGNYDIAYYLLSKGANINNIYWEYYCHDDCPLSIAISQNLIDIVRFLVEHGADINIKLQREVWDNKFAYECPLSIAIKNNLVEIVRFLVENGANVNIKLYDGFREYLTPLKIADKNNLSEIAEFLIEHGAKNNI